MFQKQKSYNHYGFWSMQGPKAMIYMPRSLLKVSNNLHVCGLCHSLLNVERSTHTQLDDVRRKTTKMICIIELMFELSDPFQVQNSFPMLPHRSLHFFLEEIDR